MKEAVVEQQIKISKLERQGSNHLSDHPKAATPTETSDIHRINPGDGNETDVSTRVAKTEEQEREKERTEKREAKREEKEVKREEREGVEREEKEEVKREAKDDGGSKDGRSRKVASVFAPSSDSDSDDSDSSSSPESPPVKPKIGDPPRGFTPSQPPKIQPAGFGSLNKPA